MVAELGKIGIHYEIVNAVDARDLDLSDARLFDPVSVSSLPRGSFGCALSHLEVYRRVLDAGLETALVLEDDVVLPADLSVLLEAITQHMRGAEVVLLNFQSYEVRFSRTGSVSVPSSRLIVQIVDKGSPWSSAAYLITREACARMVRTVLPVKARADSWAFFYREGVIDQVRCVVPMPVENNMALRTTRDNFRPGSIPARVLETVEDAKVPLLHQALAFRRRRNFRHYRSGHVEFVEDFPGGEPLPVLSRNSRTTGRS
jgi:glycosyl transferase family 25